MLLTCESTNDLVVPYPANLTYIGLDDFIATSDLAICHDDDLQRRIPGDAFSFSCAL